MKKYFLIVFMTINLVTVPQAHAGIFSALAKIVTLSSKNVNKGQKVLKPSKKLEKSNNHKMPKHLDKVLNVGDVYNMVSNKNCDNQGKNKAKKTNCESDN